MRGCLLFLFADDDGGPGVTKVEVGDNANVVDDMGSMIGFDNPEELATKLCRKKMKNAITRFC